MAKIQFVLPSLERARVCMALPELSGKHDWRMEMDWKGQWDSVLSLAHLGFPEPWITSTVWREGDRDGLPPVETLPHPWAWWAVALCVEGLLVGHIPVPRQVCTANPSPGKPFCVMKRPLNFPFIMGTGSHFFT